MLEHLAGVIDLDRAVELVTRNTRRMAKRQLTWFRSFGEVRWFEMSDASSVDAVAQDIADYLQSDAAKDAPP